MGRPLKFNRDEAIETAMLTFRKKGYARTSVSDLAAAMNITRSSFYNSFESKSHLFEETAQLYLNPKHGKPLRDAMQRGHVGTGLHAFFRHICTILETAPGHCGCLIMNSLFAAKNNDDAPEAVQLFMVNKKAQFTVLLERAVRIKEIAPIKNIEAMADSMLSFLVGLNMMGREKKPDGYLYDVAKTYLNTIGFRDGK